MTTNYAGQRRPQRKRRKALEDLRQQLGDRLFADFIIDVLSENGSHVMIESYSSLVPCYALKIASRDDGEGVSLWGGVS
jgi:hypothetical protein